MDVVTRHKRIINKQDVINLDSCYNPSKPLLAFQPDIQENDTLEAIEYSYERIKTYFENMDNTIDMICKSIVLEIVNDIEFKHS
jgi:uncharacterized protein (DUF1499 family)